MEQLGNGGAVRRFTHGSRVPGWDEAVDLEKDPAVVPDPATTPVPDDLRTAIEAEMAKFPPGDERAATVSALRLVQRHYGWCSPEGIVQAACVLRQTPGELIGVASFYDMLELRPVGRNTVYVCTNISCSLCGADELYATFLEHGADDPAFNIRSFECLGACDIAPMASINGDYVGPITPADVPGVLEDLRAGRTPLADRRLAERPSADPKAREGGR